MGETDLWLAVKTLVSVPVSSSHDWLMLRAKPPLPLPRCLSWKKPRGRVFLLECFTLIKGSKRDIQKSDGSSCEEDEQRSAAERLHQ